MYRLLRNTHLFLGIAALLFLMMYGLSSVQMAHSKWFSNRTKVTEIRVTVSPNVGDDPRALGDELRRAGFRGELQNVEPDAAGFQFEHRPSWHGLPGRIYSLQACVRINTAGFMGMLNRIHHAGAPGTATG
jgi:hypothetical protein